MDALSGGLGKKSFWKSEAGGFGKFFLALMGIGGLVGLYYGLPIAIVLMQDGLHAIFLGIGLFVTLMLLMNPGVHLIFQRVMMAITHLAINMDPIFIMKRGIVTMRQHIETVLEQIANLRGQMKRLMMDIQTNDKDVEDCMKDAAEARKRGQIKEAESSCRNATLAQTSNVKLQLLYTKLEALYSYLVKTQENGSIIVDEAEFNVKVSERERNAVNAGHRAMSAAKILFHGKDPMVSEAEEALADQLSEKIGDMEEFMRMSADVMDKVDRKNSVAIDEGMKMLDAWEKKGSSAMLGTAKQQLVSQAYNPSEVPKMDLNQPLKVPVGNKKSKYSDMIAN